MNSDFRSWDHKVFTHWDRESDDVIRGFYGHGIAAIQSELANRHLPPRTQTAIETRACRIRAGKPSIRPLDCVVCGSRFAPTTSTQKTCCPDCSKKWKHRAALNRLHKFRDKCPIGTGKFCDDAEVHEALAAAHGPLHDHSKLQSLLAKRDREYAEAANKTRSVSR